MMAGMRVTGKREGMGAVTVNEGGKGDAEERGEGVDGVNMSASAVGRALAREMCCFL